MWNWAWIYLFKSSHASLNGPVSIIIGYTWFLDRSNSTHWDCISKTRLTLTDWPCWYSTLLMDVLYWKRLHCIPCLLVLCPHMNGSCSYRVIFISNTELLMHNTHPVIDSTRTHPTHWDSTWHVDEIWFRHYGGYARRIPNLVNTMKQD